MKRIGVICNIPQDGRPNNNNYFASVQYKFSYIGKHARYIRRKKVPNFKMPKCEARLTCDQAVFQFRFSLLLPSTDCRPEKRAPDCKLRPGNQRKVSIYGNSSEIKVDELFKKKKLYLSIPYHVCFRIIQSNIVIGCAMQY